MGASKPVIVYGAAGYTGRLVCEYLREFNVPFIAAGRDRAETRAALDRVPGLESVDHEVVEVAHDADALTGLFAGASVVCNTVGPFMRLGAEVVTAALAAGCHYVDVTGEQNWLLAAQARWHDEFARRGLLLAPGVAQMYTTGEIAANLCLEEPGLDTLDILVLWKGLPTPASAQTIYTILADDWYYLEQNEYRTWPTTTTFEMVVPGRHELALATPWGGTSHPVWFKNDPRVANVKVAGGVFDRAVMEGVAATTRMVEEKVKTLPVDRQAAALAEIADGVRLGSPPRENPRLNSSLDSVYASGPLGRAHCVIHGNSNYKQTGLLQAYAAYALLQRTPKVTGFASACQAFGHRELLGVLRGFGLIMEPVLTVHR